MSIDDKTIQNWSAPFRNWHYHPDHVVPAKPDIQGFEGVHMTDVPTVFQIAGDKKWYMTFIGFDGKGYQSFVAESDDLVNWNNMRLAMGFGKEGEFDFGGRVLGGFFYEDYGIKAPRTLILETEMDRGRLRQSLWLQPLARNTQNTYGYSSISRKGFRSKILPHPHPSHLRF